MRSLMIFVVLLAAVPVTAQNPSGNEPSLYHPPHTNLNCPVVLRLERRSSVAMRQTEDGSVTSGQELRLNFLSEPRSPVMQIDLTVHGYSGGVIAQPLTVTSAKDMVEDFHLAGTSDRPIRGSSVWTRSITAITWIELTRVVLADGTTWQRTAPGECAFEPSLYVPVDAR